MSAPETITLRIPFVAARLGDLFITVMESGYSPWVRAADLCELIGDELVRFQASRAKKPRLVWWGHDALWACRGYKIKLRYLGEDDAEREVALKRSDLAKGLELMAIHSPRRLGMILNDDSDGPTSDAWLQCVVFGKMVYE